MFPGWRFQELEKGKAVLPALSQHQAQIGAEPDARDWADWQDAVERAHYERFEVCFMTLEGFFR